MVQVCRKDSGIALSLETKKGGKMLAWCVCVCVCEREREREREKREKQKQWLSNTNNLHFLYKLVFRLLAVLCVTTYTDVEVLHSGSR